MSSSSSNAGPDRARRGTFTVLRHHDFRNVWIAAFISSLGGWMEIIGVQWAMARATLDPTWVERGLPSAPMMMAALAAAQLLPQLFLGIIGGVVADRVDRRRLLLVTQAMRMGIAGGLCVVAWQGAASPWALLILGGLDGVAMAFNIPAWQVLTPRLVPRDELPDAITLNGLQFNLARALGPAIGGLILVWYDVAGLFLLNALSFLAVLVAVWTTAPAPPPANADRRAGALIREAAHYILDRRGALHLIFWIAMYSALATPLLRFMPIIIKEVYLPDASDEAQELAYGLTLGAMGLGAVGGALTVRLIPLWYPKHHFVPLSMALCAVTLCWFAASSSIWGAAAAVMACGVFWMWAFNGAYSALQMLIEDRVRGRVLAICNTIAFGAMPLGAFFGSLAGEGLAIALTGRNDDGLAALAGLGLLGIVLLIFSLAVLTFRVPEVDGHESDHAAATPSPGLFRGITASAHRPPPEEGSGLPQAVER